MSNKIKSMRSIESSFMQYSNKSLKNIMAASYVSHEHAQSSANVQSDIARLIKKHGHLYYKSDVQEPKEREKKVANQRENELNKKILFDHQELRKKNKHLEKINEKLKEENKKLIICLCTIQENFRSLSVKYNNLIAEHGLQFQDNFQAPKIVLNESSEDKIKQQEAQSDISIDIFTKLFIGASTKSQIINLDLPVLKQKQEETKLIQNFVFRKSVSRDAEPQAGEMSRRNTVFSFRRSHSLQTQNVQTQTSFHQQCFQASTQILQQKNNSVEFILSPSSRESQLLTKISHYESAFRQLQKKNYQILGKYERIKSIIGGETKTN